MSDEHAKPDTPFPDRASAEAACRAFRDGVEALARNLGIPHWIVGVDFSLPGGGKVVSVAYNGSIDALLDIVGRLATDVVRAAEDLAGGIEASEARMEADRAGAGPRDEDEPERSEER